MDQHRSGHRAASSRTSACRRSTRSRLTFLLGLIGGGPARLRLLLAGRARGAERGRRLQRRALAARVRAHARADRPGLRGRALLHAAALPGPGHPVPGLRPARRRVGPASARPTRQIDYTLIGANATWYWQVAFVVAGHVAALMLAHDRALALYEDAQAGGALPVLDARGDGRLHEPRAVATVISERMTSRSRTPATGSHRSRTSCPWSRSSYGWP